MSVASLGCVNLITGSDWLQLSQASPNRNKPPLHEILADSLASFADMIGGSPLLLTRSRGGHDASCGAGRHQTSSDSDAEFQDVGCQRRNDARLMLLQDHVALQLPHIEP